MVPDILVARRPGLIEAEVDRELVGLHIDNNRFYGLNRTSTPIWRLMDPPKHLSEICQP